MDADRPSWEPALLGALAQWNPGPPPKSVGRLLAYLWAAPITLVGVIVGVAAGVRPTVRDGVLLFPHAKGITGSVLRRRGFAAGTFGHVVVCTHDPSPDLMAHELQHTRQAERFGPLMAPVYLGLLAVYGYTRHPMERAARLAAAQFPDEGE